MGDTLAFTLPTDSNFLLLSHSLFDKTIFLLFVLLLELFYLNNLSEYFGVKFLADFIFGEIEEASGRSHLNVEDGLVSVGGR